MEYKGYTARVEFDPEARILFGEVEGLRDVVTFEATDVKSLEREFRASVDDYVAMCAERGEEPERPYSGKFLVRVDPMLHRQVAMAAARTGKSLNAFIAALLSRGIQPASEPRPTRTVPAPNVNRPDKDPMIIEQSAAAVEARGVDQSLNLFSGAHPNTPASKTPNTPAASRTPQPRALQPAA